ncbi:MAG: hypothetical protein LIO51_00465 [Clostridiales bacterium]|nr:hypothetical protein [Clostridiales bacterium]
MRRSNKILRRHPVIHRYLSDDRWKASVSLACSFAFNLLYALWEIGCGFYYRSYWFITLGCYYVLLSLSRLLLLRQAHGKNGTQRMGWRRYRTCGILLLLLNFILSGIVVLAVLDRQGANYAGYLVYVMAAYTFYRVGMAIRNLFKFRKTDDPVISASKIIGFVSAIVSLLSLEIAMVLQFGGDGDFFRAMTALTGAGACLIITGTAVRMILTAQRKLRINFDIQ